MRQCQCHVVRERRGCVHVVRERERRRRACMCRADMCAGCACARGRRACACAGAGAHAACRRQHTWSPSRARCVCVHALAQGLGSECKLVCTVAMMHSGLLHACDQRRPMHDAPGRSGWTCHIAYILALVVHRIEKKTSSKQSSHHTSYPQPPPPRPPQGQSQWGDHTNPGPHFRIVP